MNEAAKTLGRLRAVPVVLCVRYDDPDAALAAARAALDGGLAAIEVTLTTPGALEILGELVKDDRAVPGAGTVLSAEDVRRVAAAGACFAMSPVALPEVVAEANRLGLLAIPGAATPTEILSASRMGAPVVKVFPIGPLGGPDYIRAVRGPFPDIPLLPTNGVSLESVPAYFAAGVVAVGVGREILAPEALARGDFGEIRRRAERFARAVRVATGG